MSSTLLATDTTKMDRSGFSWALFEGGRNPYVILCTIYILAPYIATTVFSDPVEGQAAIASWHRSVVSSWLSQRHFWVRLLIN